MPRTPPISTKPKRSRARAPKVRTGCLTCKTRRVKCDEGKPSCVRCLTFGCPCDGYSHSSSPTPPRDNTQLTSFKWRHLVPKYRPTGQPYTARFTSENEFLYFQSFCQGAEGGRNGFFAGKIWKTIILQACEQEEAVRCAAIALGALGMKSLTPRTQKKILEDRKFAFGEYSKAITKLRRKLSEAGEGEGQMLLRTALIACLLFTCFETLNGFLHGAVNQIYNGLHIISSFRTQHCPSLQNQTSITSPRPHIIEDDLIQAFDRLEVEAMTFADARPREIHHQHLLFGQVSIDTMPALFRSVAEARAYATLIAHRGMHLAAWHKSLLPDSSGLDSINAVLTKDNMKLSGEYAPPPEVLKSSQDIYDRWDIAFEPVWRMARNGGEENIYKEAVATKLHSLTAVLCKNSMSGQKENLYGACTPLLEQIMRLSEILLDSSESDNEQRLQQNLGFNFDRRIIVPLNMVGTVYRHRGLRRKAEDLLLRRPWREGLWDSWVVGKTISWLTDLEEEGLPGVEEMEHIPEENVVMDIQIHQDDATRTSTISCLQPVQGKEGEYVRRKLVLPTLDTQDCQERGSSGEG